MATGAHWGGCILGFWDFGGEKGGDGGGREGGGRGRVNKNKAWNKANGVGMYVSEKWLIGRQGERGVKMQQMMEVEVEVEVEVEKERKRERERV